MEREESERQAKAHDEEVARRIEGIKDREESERQAKAHDEEVARRLEGINETERPALPEPLNQESTGKPDELRHVPADGG